MEKYRSDYEKALNVLADSVVVNTGTDVWVGPYGHISFGEALLSILGLSITKVFCSTPNGRRDYVGEPIAGYIRVTSTNGGRHAINYGDVVVDRFSTADMLWHLSNRYVSDIDFQGVTSVFMEYRAGEGFPNRFHCGNTVISFETPCVEEDDIWSVTIKDSDGNSKSISFYDEKVAEAILLFAYSMDKELVYQATSALLDVLEFLRKMNVAL